MRNGSDFRATNSTEVVGNNPEMVVPALYLWVGNKNVQEILDILNEVGETRNCWRDGEKKNLYLKREENW